MKVNQAVILAGGRGTRFLPFAKSCPKEMLPVGDVPALQFLVREVVDAGIKDITIVINPDKKQIVSYFKEDKWLNNFLFENNRAEELNKVLNVCEGANIRFVEQKKPNGSGGAVMACAEFLQGKPFAYLNGDDLIFSQTGVTSQLLRQFGKEGKSVVGVQSVKESETSLYGIVIGDKKQNGLTVMKELKEKPKVSPSSRLALLGRNIFSADFFKYLDRIPPAPSGEYLLTDAICLQAKHDTVLAYEFEGKRFDLGNKTGFAQSVAWNMAIHEHDESYINFLRELLGCDRV